MENYKEQAALLARQGASEGTGAAVVPPPGVDPGCLTLLMQAATAAHANHTHMQQVVGIICFFVSLFLSFVLDLVLLL
jgi:hypothetical protein